MKSIKALWGQRMKWQVGTVEDLLDLGVNRLTLRDWGQQAMGLLGRLPQAPVARRHRAASLALGRVSGSSCSGGWCRSCSWHWTSSGRCGSRTATGKTSLLAASFFPQELFMWLRSGWFLASWWAVLTGKITRRRIDRWEAQYTAEEIN